MNDDDCEIEKIIENCISDKLEYNMDIILEHKTILENSILSLGYKLIKRKELLKKINKYIQKKCQHEFIIDYIDSMKDYQISEKIVYCNKCDFVKPF